MTNLHWLQHWYAEQTNGDWEHQYGIQVESLDNPGWYLLVDLIETPYAQALEGFEGKKDHGEVLWYRYHVKEGKFEAWGDPLRLDTLVRLFREMVSEWEDIDERRKSPMPEMTESLNS